MNAMQEQIVSDARGGVDRVRVERVVEACGLMRLFQREQCNHKHYANTNPGLRMFRGSKRSLIARMTRSSGGIGASSPDISHRVDAAAKH